VSCLIVEDESYFAQVLQRAMQNHFSQVDIASDGEQALGLAKGARYSLILLDLTIPKIDGLFVLQRLRGEGVMSHILIVSGRDAVAQRIEGLRAGADDYICKPFHMDELRARVRALMRRPVPQLLRLSVADLVLDTVRLSVTRGGKRIELCKKEFAILEYLMRNSGYPVTRALLMDHCWDGKFEGSSSIIDVYINYLRRKIDQGFEKKLIHTLRGVGYTILDNENNALAS
jgi:DNA-binding response OmpR family regulator